MAGASRPIAGVGSGTSVSTWTPTLTDFELPRPMGCPLQASVMFGRGSALECDRQHVSSGRISGSVFWVFHVCVPAYLCLLSLLSSLSLFVCWVL